MVTNGENDVSHFSLTQTEDLVFITSFKFDYLTPTNRKIFQFMDEYEVIRSCTMIELDQGNDSEIDKYLRKSETIVILDLLGLFTRLLLINFIFLFVEKCRPF